MNGNDRAHQELLVLYQAYLDDLREAKRSQWRAIYYGLLLLGGLFAYVEIRAQAMGCTERVIVWLLCAFALGFLVWYLWDLQFNMAAYRININKIRKSLSIEFRFILKEGRTHQDYKFPSAFSVVLVAGSGLLFWHLFPGQLCWLIVSHSVVFLILAMLVVVTAIRCFSKHKTT